MKKIPLQPTSLAILKKKYPCDGDIVALFQNVATKLASGEKDSLYWSDEFYRIMKNGCIPAGRILAHLGGLEQPNVHTSAINCTVSEVIEDSLKGIFRALSRAALTLKAGCGIGYDFSTLRPAGAHVKGVNAISSGPVSFLAVFDSMCKVIASAGGRRGAQLATLRVDHPDIMAFIKAKQTPDSLQTFNLSVGITDAFMRAVEENATWDLIFDGKVYETVNANDIWDAITESNYLFSEPGVLFLDRIKEDALVGETITTTNPCGEQPLPPNGACLLGSINLTSYVLNPFTTVARFDTQQFQKDAVVFHRLLDNVVEHANLPLPEQTEELLQKRRHGMGVFGLGSTITMMGMTYGDSQSIQFTDRIFNVLSQTVHQANEILLKEKGNAPYSDIQLRFTHGLSVAPTGTIALTFGNNCSGGIEPSFTHTYTKNVTKDNGERVATELHSYEYLLFRELFGEDKPLPETFKKATEIDPLDHMQIQRAAQKWVDGSISKTINIPADSSLEDFRDIYKIAHQWRLKGCTTFRPSAIRPGILEETVITTDCQTRPQTLIGKTHKVKLPATGNMYVTINWFNNHPFEIFLNSMDSDYHAWRTAFAVVLSAFLRTEQSIDFLLEDLKAIHDPKGGFFVKGTYIPSVPAMIAELLDPHSMTQTQKEDNPQYKLCPNCKSYALQPSDGCDTCVRCGYSKCGEQ